jgi:hypothetical protein
MTFWKRTYGDILVAKDQGGRGEMNGHSTMELWGSGTLLAVL